MKVDTIYRTDDWSALINTPYTRIELTKYLLENNGSTTQNLHHLAQAYLKTSIDIEVFTHYMKLWSKHYTTYFNRYGRVIDVLIDGELRWFYFKADHPYSRQTKEVITKHLSSMF